MKCCDLRCGGVPSHCLSSNRKADGGVADCYSVRISRTRCPMETRSMITRMHGTEFGDDSSFELEALGSNGNI